MPRWVVVLLVAVTALWLLSDPSGLAAFLKGIADSLIKFTQELS
jgi:hypothetical protein